MKALPRQARGVLLIILPLLVGADGNDPLRFVRVHVPSSDMTSIGVGRDRYIPMSLADFDAALDRLQRHDLVKNPLDAVSPLIDVVHYDAQLNADVNEVLLRGIANWSLSEAIFAPTLSLGQLMVTDAQLITSAGTGDAIVFGQSDGSLSISTPKPGDYMCDWHCSVIRDVGESKIILPLVPALTSVIHLSIPQELIPYVPGAVVREEEDATNSSSQRTWRIEVGPQTHIEFRLRSAQSVASLSKPRLVSWTDVKIVGSQIRVQAIFEPDSVWESAFQSGRPASEGVLALSKSPSTLITDVILHNAPPLSTRPQWIESEDGLSVQISLPTACLGRKQAIRVDAVAPLPPNESLFPLPLFSVQEEVWAGGGIIIHTDPAQLITDIELTRAEVVAAEAIASWKVPYSDTASVDNMQPVQICIEQQGPNPQVDVSVGARTADVSVQRVTVVDVSPQAVLGRATAHVRVSQGEAFEIRGSLGKGWFIDSVELISASPETPLSQAMVDAVNEPPDWRVVRQKGRNELRVAFKSAVTPANPMLLQITGHRSGISPGVSFSASELDMVVLRDEVLEPVLALKTGAEMTIEAEQDTEPATIGDPQLSTLIEDSGVRIRLPAGRRGSRLRLTLVRRRPPLNVDTEVRLTSRDGRLVESFTFECVPERNEIDSIVVNFSTVMDDRLDWQVLPPAAGSIVARRVEAAVKPRRSQKNRIADTWVVELTPAAGQPVTIRAVCTIPFLGPTPVPVAWVDGAFEQKGTLTIREAGRFRPRVINHHLKELPPRDEAADQAYSTVGEFSFDVSRLTGSDLQPVAELIPGGGIDGEDARAWAWREQTTVWCHSAGATEYETVFDIENHGRANVSFTLPSVLQLQGALVDGQRVQCVARGTGGGDVLIELPLGRRSLTLTVRAVAQHSAKQGWWRVDIQGGSLDVPVLQRDVRVLLGPDVEIGQQSESHRIVNADTSSTNSWLFRLFGAVWQHSSPSKRLFTTEGSQALVSDIGGDEDLTVGYRDYRFVPVVGRRDRGSLIIIEAWFVRSAALVAAVLGVILVLSLPTESALGIFLLTLLAGVLSLWVPEPFNDVSRAVWWSMLIGIILRLSVLRMWFPLSGFHAGAWVALYFFLTPHAAYAFQTDDDLYKVFITSVDESQEEEPLAIVPESLFRQISQLGAQTKEPRVLACSITDSSESVTGRGEEWELSIDVDVDAGMVFVLDQSAVGGRVRSAHLDGVAIPIAEDSTGINIPFSESARHRLVCQVTPGWKQYGQIVIKTIAIPVSPRSFVKVSNALAAVTICEHRVAAEPYVPSPTRKKQSLSRAEFDVSRANSVRIVSPIDARQRLARGVSSLESQNDLFWDADKCRLTSRFSLDSVNEITRSFIVRLDVGTVCDAADITLETDGDQDGLFRVMPLGRNRYLVERSFPQTGEFSVQLDFDLPFSDPVGVFTIPSAWIENVVKDARSTQIIPLSGLSVDVQLPENAALVQNDTNPLLQSIAWRTDVGKGNDRNNLDSIVSTTDRGTLTIRRQQSTIRASQRLSLEFTAEQIGMELLARIDAGNKPLAETVVQIPADAIVDRVQLFSEESLGQIDETRRPVDISWSRSAQSIKILSQQPQTGRFRLEVEARVEERVSNRGTLVMMRADIASAGPLSVVWTSRDQRGVAVLPVFSEAIGEEGGVPLGESFLTRGSLDISGGEPALQYERGNAVQPMEESDVKSSPQSSNDQQQPVKEFQEKRHERVELADVALVLDQRGRCWGSVRFDVIVDRSTLQLSLPTGMRLFEALVDGRPASAVPRDDGTWEISLLTSHWPRSVLAVFAGDKGSQAGDGKPFEIGAPQLEGLPCNRMLWKVQTPGGDVLKIAEPARAVTRGDYQDERASALMRLSDDFNQAIQQTQGIDRQRLEEFVALRKDKDLLSAERAWVPVVDNELVGGPVLYAVVDEPMDGVRLRGLALRVGRHGDATVRGRVLATLFILGLAVIVWKVVQQWPSACVKVVQYCVPIVLAGAGCAWLLFLKPIWPGLFMVLAAGFAVVPKMYARFTASPSDETTVAQFATPTNTSVIEVSSAGQIPIPQR
ncbi:MAG: hypothetical protein ABGW78_12920 [Pirellulales bacterium]